MTSFCVRSLLASSPRETRASRQRMFCTSSATLFIANWTLLSELCFINTAHLVHIYSDQVVTALARQQQQKQQLSFSLKRSFCGSIHQYRLHSLRTNPGCFPRICLVHFRVLLSVELRCIVCYRPCSLNHRASAALGSEFEH